MAPLQDVLDLGPEARMNVPGSASGNWRWRYRENTSLLPAFEWLQELTDRSRRSSAGIAAQLPVIIAGAKKMA
jgi:4-alpha-glucanotransferase